jgi:hypothetical protein
MVKGLISPLEAFAMRSHPTVAAAFLLAVLSVRVSGAESLPESKDKIVLQRSAPGSVDYQKAISKVSRLRLRETPNTGAPIVGYLAKGESAAIVDKSTFTSLVNDHKDYWFQVLNSTGTKGWVFGGYLHVPPEH